MGVLLTRWAPGNKATWRPSGLTCLHALVVFLRRHRPVVGLVDGRPEALVAAPPPDDAGAGPVEGEVPVEGHLGDGRLEALQRAGLLQAERRAHVLRGRT